MAGAGATRLYAKSLACNDNSKNQVYFGGGFEVLNLLPSGDPVPSNDRANPIFKSAVKFGWIDELGHVEDAPGAQLILYPQYPEVRFSGFLRGTRSAPSAIMASRDEGRVLFLGVLADGMILGLAAPAHSPLAVSFDRAVSEPASAVFRELALPNRPASAASKERLLSQLLRVHRKEWISSWRLGSSGQRLPCEAPNCGGLTLEAELGIRPNSYSLPDFEGWEIKQHTVASFANVGVGVLTLMTPEPTGGLYRDSGVESFVRRFGYRDIPGRGDRMNFGGTYRAGARFARTGLTMTLRGFDSDSGKIVDPTGGIYLIDDNQNEAASWSFSGLMSHWKRKHAKAAYVPSQKRIDGGSSYRYGSRIRIGEGTDFLLFLAAMAAGTIYYDPGIKLETTLGSIRTKRRSQFRTRSKDLRMLYERFSEVDLLKVTEVR